MNATVKLPSGEYLIQEVPDGATDIVNAKKFGTTNKLYGTVNHKRKLLSQFPGSWQLLGADPTNLTEIEAGEIVESFVDDENTGDYYYYDYPSKDGGYLDPRLSLDSLAGSLGISKPFVVLRNTKNIEK